MTLEELKEQYEAELHPVVLPKTETKNIYDGPENSKQGEVKEADGARPDSLTPCLYWASGSCLTREMPVNTCCENCWSAHMLDRQNFQFWD